MQLETDLVSIDNVTADQLRAELARLDRDSNTRAILSSDERTYIQTAVFGNGYVIEKRCGGGDETHFHAVPRHAELPPLEPKPELSWWQRLLWQSTFPTSECAFTLDQLQQVFRAYLEGRESDVPKQWDQGFCDR